MFADPVPLPVTGTVMLAVFAGIVTLAGTVATDVLLEVRLTTTGELEALEMLNVRF